MRLVTSPSVNHIAAYIVTAITTSATNSNIALPAPSDKGKIGKAIPLQALTDP